MNRENKRKQNPGHPLGCWCCLYCLLLLAAGCTLDGGLEVCPYNVRFAYEVCDGRGFATADYPIRRLRQFVYDEQGILVGEFPGEPCRTGVGMLTLPPGQYTLVAWGNAADSACNVRNTEPGVHRLEEAEMRAWSYDADETDRATRTDYVSPATREPAFRTTDLLYYGQLPFSVPTYGVAFYRVGMMHSHARLNLTIEWEDEAPEAVRNAGNLHMEVRGIETGYRFTSGETWGDYLFPCPHPQAGAGTYRQKAAAGYPFKLTAGFVTFRLRDDDHPLVTLTQDGHELIEPIDLSRYFRVMAIGLTYNLRQEFNLTIRIERNRTVIMETNISGWEEGGDIGTSYG